MNLFLKTTTTLCSLFLLSTASQAAVQMRPGLWELEITTATNGKTTEDPFAKINKLPKEQRDMMLKAMKMQAGSSPNSQRVCYTKEDIEKYSALNSQGAMADYCTQKIKNSSAKVINAEITCKDGYKGTATMVYESDKKMHTTNEGVNAKGDKISVKTNAKFISDKCSQNI